MIDDPAPAVLDDSSGAFLRPPPIPSLPPAPARAANPSRPRLRAIGRALRRSLAAVAASVLAPLLVGAVSGRAHAPFDPRGAALREAALLLPFALPLALVLLPLAVAASAPRLASVLAAFTRDALRTRATAATLLLGPAAFVSWIALLTHANRFFLTAFHHVGLAALAQATALALATVAYAFAFLALRTLVAVVLPSREARHFAAWAVLGLIAALALVAVGTESGTLDGRGGFLGVFGVLRRPALELSPVYTGTALVLASLALTAVLSRSAVLGFALLLLGSSAAAFSLRETVYHFGDAPSAATLETRPGLARTVLRTARRLTDRDHDGASAYLGGGDCNDHDSRVFPDARDLPGNRLDEDCSGADTPLPPPPAPVAPTVAPPRLGGLPSDLSLLLITVDALRSDLHYAGNPRPVSPSLDRLAEQSVVFDRAYSLSSYTGASIGPTMIGRYPTECARDSQHFLSYGSSNVLLAERLRDAGFATFGGASHFYFIPHFGLSQGIVTWDMSARPSTADQETTSADDAVCDRAVALLRTHATDTERFFEWVHFFDPHSQYVSHAEFASFGDDERARYDAEVAWTDRQIGRLLDALATMPFADRTAVMVTADHGEAFGEHHMALHGFELWEELVHVPWIVRVPGVAPRHVPTPRSHIDLAPTVLDLLRVPAPARDSDQALSGESLVPDLLGEPSPPRPVYFELPEGPNHDPRRGIVDQGWKLVQFSPWRFALYDLEHDPGERHDLARTNLPEFARMRALLGTVRGGMRVVPAHE